MSLPELIVANNIPTGSATPNGIIATLRPQVPNFLDFVVASSNTARNFGDVSNIVTWSGGFQTNNNKEAYVQVEFKERYVFATHYSLKGYYD